MTRSSQAAAQRLASAAPLFAALGEPARLRIVAKLCEAGPLPIVRLTEGASISRQGITKHLHALSDAGPVRNERRGRENLWRLEPLKLAQAQRFSGFRLSVRVLTVAIAHNTHFTYITYILEYTYYAS